MTPAKHGHATPARRAALTVLLRARVAKAPGVDQLLSDASRKFKCPPPDIALAREIIYTVLRHRMWLEHLLAQRVQEPLRERAPEIHESLLIGLAQLAFLDRVPKRAAVDETVKMAANQPEGQHLKALVNAVMRRFSEQKQGSLIPSNETDYRLKYSVPDYINTEVGFLLEDTDREAFFGASNIQAPLCFRLRTKADDPRSLFTEWQNNELEISRSESLEDCVIVRGRGLNPATLVTFRNGSITVEDEGAQIACALAQPDSAPKRILDVCAAPGGKTAHLADAFPDAEIVACDISKSKRARMAETLQRLNLQSHIEIADSNEILESAEDASFDFVLVDAPCSGWGTLRRHPEIRYRRAAADLSQLAETQFRILDRSARLVKASGLLSFVTCTVSEAEGENTRDRFLKEHSEFSLTDAPDNTPPSLALTRIDQGFYRIWTHRFGCDSFTVTRFLKAS